MGAVIPFRLNHRAAVLGIYLAKLHLAKYISILEGEGSQNTKLGVLFRLPCRLAVRHEPQQIYRVYKVVCYPLEWVSC